MMMAQFFEKWWEHFAINADNVSTQAVMDRLSKNEIFFKCFKTILKRCGSSLSETILSALVLSDEIITDAIDFFGRNAETFREREIFLLLISNEDV